MDRRTGERRATRYRVRSCSPIFRPLAFVTALGAATLAPSAAPAASVAPGRARVSVAARDVVAVPAVIGRDISFPQCGGPLPDERHAVFGILGANGGMSFTRNPCLVAELAWAKRLEAPPAFYANTGNPGPHRAKHWPLGQTAPKVCSARDPNSLGCSYDYGWNSAWHSYTAATDAAQRLHRVDRVNARRRAANVDWWLDVETMNSWQTINGRATRAAKERDVAALNGEIDALRIAGVERVGVYSTALQWLQITGGTKIDKSRFLGAPQWLAGYTSRADAIAGCADRGFTGGPVAMTQYLGTDGFDSNVLCTQTGGA
jgi:hypothetical protein